MEHHPSARNFFFCIPLMPKVNASDWTQVCNVFNQTLRSIANQTNKSFRILLAAQDKPDIDPDLKLDIVHLLPRWTIESDADGKGRDKRWKRKLLLGAVRKLGGGYVMMLDADDLVSNRLVEYVLNDQDPHGYIVEVGYAYDWKANLIAPIPGVWGQGFDSVCGSCSVINFKPEDLPSVRRGNKATVNHLSGRLKGHSQWKHVMRDAGRPLKSVPFPAVVYVLNHDNNLHFSAKPRRQITVPRKIRLRQVPLSTDLVKEFSLPVQEAPPIRPMASTAGKTRNNSRLFSDCSERLPNFSVAVAFDVGVMTEQTTRSILEYYPDALVHAFPLTLAALESFKELIGPHSNIIINRMTSRSESENVASTEGGAAMDVAETSVTEAGEELAGDSYCERHGIDHLSYLKIRNERLDLKVLKSFGRMIGDQRIDLIQVEAGMNPFNKHHVGFSALCSHMESCRYYLFGIYDQTRESRGRPMLRRCSPVFISRVAIGANMRTAPSTRPTAPLNEGKRPFVK